VKLFNILLIIAVAYVGLVVAFESLIGILQPADESTLVLTTSDKGQSHERVLSRLETDGKLYVAVNHWPRAWYKRARANPSVRVTLAGQEGGYQAIPVTGDERSRVEADHPLGFGMRFLMGFAPRHFVRLDPSAPPVSKSEG
jgi:hypothetical protein